MKSRNSHQQHRVPGLSNTTSRPDHRRAGTTALVTLAFFLVALVATWSPACAVSAHLLFAPEGTEESGDLYAFGTAIASAGDWNGDGYDDVLVGEGEAGEYDFGAAYIYFGGPEADDVADITLTRPSYNENFGRYVAPAGDFNHDGHPDVLVACYDWDYAWNVVYLYYGGPDADTEADLNFGASVNASFGKSMGSIGDFNGDGIDDLAIGSPEYDDGYGPTGKVYLYYGGTSPDGIADLTFCEHVYQGRFGESVSTAGDFNGDGFADLVVGSPGLEDAVLFTGNAYVYFGGADPDTLFDSLLDESDYGRGYHLGCSVAGGGDLNGDGFDDVIVGADKHTNEGEALGETIVYLGNRAGVGGADLVIKAQYQHYLGREVASLGDVNGDGFDDFVTSAAQSPDLDYNGYVQLHLGGPALSETPDLLFTPVYGLFEGRIAAAGDIDGDGFNDVLMGCGYHAWDRGRIYVYAMQPLQMLSPNGGEVWVTGGEATLAWRGAEPADVALSLDGGFSWETIASDIGGHRENRLTVTTPAFPTTNARVAVFPSGESPQHRFAAQSVSSFSVVEPGDPPPVTHLLQQTVYGEGSGDELGMSVAPIGDFNGDGYDDYVVGAPDADGGHTDLGCAYIYYGGPETDDEPDLTLISVVTGSRFGFATAAAGDVNGDGFDDVIIGASDDGSVWPNGGAAFVFFGGATPDATADLLFRGVEDSERFGIRVSSAGDVNGDSFDDLMVGAIYSDAGGSNIGRVYVFHGGPAADHVPDWILTGEADGDLFGYSIAALGDVNQDGFGDVAIGAPNNDATGSNAGRCYVFWGGPAADDIADITMSGEGTSDKFGVSAAAADVNGDAVLDLIVGAHEHDQPAEDFGAVYVFFGGRFMNAVYDMKLHGEGPDESFGWSLASAGDVNVDGYDDIIVGASLNDAGGSSTGRAYVYFGGPRVDALPNITLTGEQSGADFAKAVAGAGDVNDDGFPDLLVGAPGYNEAGSNDGAVFLFDVDRYRLVTSLTGGTWNVGATYPVEWYGAEPADLWLSVDGGASYTVLERGAGGQALNSTDVTVPHQPTRYARFMMTCSDTEIFGEVCADSFFTIDASVELIQFRAAPDPGIGDAVILSWNTDPGPEDLKGYRVTRKTSGEWETLTPMTRETSLVVQNPRPLALYRLFAINGLDEEIFLGETTLGLDAALSAWPRPYQGGQMNISFATSSGLGGGAERATVKLFDPSGRLVRTVVEGNFTAGTQNAYWDGRDEVGQPVPSGVYFLRAASGRYRNTMKLLVTR